MHQLQSTIYVKSLLIILFRMLNTRQLIDICKSDPKLSPSFLGVFAKDQIPLKIRFPSAFIVNTQSSWQNGEHWVAFYFSSEKEADFFDSFGRHPEYFGHEKYLKNTASKWRYNPLQLQSYVSHICGYYCVLFLLYRSRGFSLDDFLCKFKDDENLNDLVLINLLKS